VYIGFRLDKSVTSSDIEYEDTTVGYCQLSLSSCSFCFAASVAVDLQSS